MFVRALDRAAIARLNAVHDAVPDVTVALSTHWRLMWSVTDIAQMLQKAGYKGTKFSSVPVIRDQPATAKIGSVLQTMVDVGYDVAGYAVWADECPIEHLAHLAVGVPRTVGLLKAELS